MYAPHGLMVSTLHTAVSTHTFYDPAGDLSREIEETGSLRDSATSLLVALSLLFISPVGAQDRGLFLPEPAVAAESFGASRDDALGVTPSNWGGATVRQRRVRIAGERLAEVRGLAVRDGSSASLRLNLFADTIVRAVALNVEPRASGGYVVSGDIEGAPLGSMTLAVDGDGVVGIVRGESATFTIRSRAKGTVVIREVDPSTLPRLSQPSSPPPVDPRVRAISGPSESADLLLSTSAATSTIDVLFVYSSDTKRNLSQIESLIDVAVAEANKAYRRSGVNLEFRAHKAEVAYAETEGIADLRRAQQSTDGYMDEVHALRARHGADFVQLISADRSFCGVAFMGLDFYSTFSSVSTVCLEGGTVAHELGHSLGLDHDRFSNWGGGEKPYGYGYINLRGFEPGVASSRLWRTIMAYSTLCEGLGVTCNRVMRFSNPNQSINGDPLGIAGSDDVPLMTGPADAARAANDMRAQAAALDSRPVYIGQISDLALVKDQAGTWTLPEAVGADGPLSYSLSPVLPQGITRTGRTLTGTPSELSSPKSYIWRATDADGDSVEAAFSIGVYSTAPKSTAVPLQGINDQLLLLGQKMNDLKLPTMRGGAKPITYELRPQLPSGLKLKKRKISGTPTEVWDRSHTWEATDKNGVSSTVSFRIHVRQIAIDLTKRLRRRRGGSSGHRLWGQAL